MISQSDSWINFVTKYEWGGGKMEENRLKAQCSVKLFSCLQFPWNRFPDLLMELRGATGLKGPESNKNSFFTKIA